MRFDPQPEFVEAAPHCLKDAGLKRQPREAGIEQEHAYRALDRSCGRIGRWMGDDAPPLAVNQFHEAVFFDLLQRQSQGWAAHANLLTKLALARKAVAPDSIRQRLSQPTDRLHGKG